VVDGERDERFKPSFEGDRVVVEQDYQVIACSGYARIAGYGEALRLIAAKDAKLITVAREKPWSGIARAVIDDNDLAVYARVGLRKDGVEALPGDRVFVVDGDDNAHPWQR
jgi:hypothetical protein